MPGRSAAPTANPPPPLVPWRAPFVPWAVLGRWFLRSYARLLFKARVLRKAGKPNCLEAGSARSVPTSGRCPARAGPGRYALIEHGAATTVYVRARPPHATAARHAPMHAPREERTRRRCLFRQSRRASYRNRQYYNTRTQHANSHETTINESQSHTVTRHGARPIRPRTTSSLQVGDTQCI